MLVSTSLLLVLRGFEELPARVAAFPADLYEPLGIAAAVPKAALTVGSLRALMVAAAVAAFLALVGCWSRASFAVATLGTLLLVSVQYSGQPTWSHGENLTLLVALPLLLVRTGDVWSLDARLGRVATARLPFYGPAVRAVQVMIAAYFLHAFYSKMATSGIDWALSENLSRILVGRFEVLGIEPPAAASVALTYPAVAQLMALGNLAAQAAPALLLPLLRHRWARALAATAVALEVVGLAVVMGLFHGEMAPLSLTFLAWGGTRGATDSTPRDWWQASRALAVPVLLVGAQLAISFGPVPSAIGAYPFTAVRMFASMRAETWDRLLITTSPPLPEAEHRRLQEEDSAPVGDDTCRLLRKLLIALPEAEATTGITIDEVRVDLRRWDLQGGSGTMLSSVEILRATPMELRGRFDTECG